MSWLSKQLKRTTKILDPIGNQLRKSTGGSYGDPMNWYNSKPNTTQPWEARKSPGLMAAPAGPPPAGQSFGQNTGGYNYVPNQVQQQGPSGAMSFGGGNMAPPVGMAPPPAVQQGGPRDALAQQQQMARIGAIRGNYV